MNSLNGYSASVNRLDELAHELGARTSVNGAQVSKIAISTERLWQEIEAVSQSLYEAQMGDIETRKAKARTLDELHKYNSLIR